MRRMKLAAIALGFGLTTGICAAAERITVYTAYETDEATAYLQVARQDLPDIEVELVRLSTGDLTARIKAESGDPRHDVIWGQAVTSLLDPGVLATLERYDPNSIDRLPERFRDGAGRWFAVTGYMAVLCVNHQRLAAKKLPMPRSWQDLTNPIYKSEIVMPNPLASGTGFIQIASILQDKGEEAGWREIKAIDANVAAYSASGSTPCNEAARGRYTVGVSLAERALRNIAEGLPITLVLPSEGAGNELEGNALVSSSRHKDAARRFLDWTLSERALQEYYRWKVIVTAPGGTMPVTFRLAGLPADVSKAMFTMNYEAAHRQRPAILERWRRDFQH